MRQHLLRNLPLIAIAAVLAFGPSVARAEFPERPIRIILPFPPGGAGDQTARGFADRLSKDLNTPVVIDGKPGANGIIATEAAARAEPDGYTLFLASGSMIVLNPLLYKTLSFDPARDLRPLAIATEAPMLVVVHPSVPVKTIGEFVAYAKVQGDKLNYGSSGLGNSTHLAVEMFSQMAGIRMTHVPYKGSTPGLNDLVAGQIQVMFDIVTSAWPHAQGGTLRGLAVTTGARLAMLPDMPTVAESGYPDYRASAWYGLFAPSKVPDPIAQRLSASLAKAQTDPSLRALLEKLGFVVLSPMDAAQRAKYVADDHARWSATVTSLALTLE